MKAPSSVLVVDAAILIAWSADADLWTTDRDFAGAGVASWSTPNLIRGLAPAPETGA